VLRSMLFYGNRSLYAIMCEKCDRDAKATVSHIIRRMGVTFWITKAKKAQSEYVPFNYFLR